MDQFELLPSVVLRRLGKWRTLLLRQDTVFTDLLDVVDGGQPVHHVLAPQLPQRLEVQVPVSLMPPLGDVAGASDETHWGDDVHVEEVETAW